MIMEIEPFDDGYEEIYISEPDPSESDDQDGSDEYDEVLYEDADEDTEEILEEEEGTYLEDTGEDVLLGEGADVEDTGLHERIDSLLEQISTERDYGSMGDYYIKEIGCYVYPNADVFGHFVDAEMEGAAWIEASNGCYVPVEYIEDYEAYISSSTGADEGLEELPDVSEEELSPVTVDDLMGLQDLLLDMAERDIAYQESVTAYMDASAETMEGMTFQLTIISCVLVVLCVFLALISGNRIANTFFERMRVG